uniref:hypothetical protein n=1 Tax=uncultured Draconibacterium sp. TaxID=1573823 RepID=UPI00321768B3
MVRIIAIIPFLFLFFNSYSRDNDNKEKDKTDFRIKFSGFIKYEIFSDTRQTVNAREGLVDLYPENVLYDENGNDVHAVGSLNMLSIHSRVRCNISGPVFFGALTNGLVEADFYGNENKYFSDLNGLRLFSAYMKFNWGKTELLAGQYWHPMSIPGFFPSVISFSAGAPFHPMSRNPQLQIIRKLGKLKLIGSMLSQRDFTGTGPDGPGSQYLRNSRIPNLHFQVQYSADSSGIYAGVGIDYKKIVPELHTENEAGEIFATKKSLTGILMMGFIKATTTLLTIKAQGVYAQNGYDQLMLGGYAVKEITNVQTGEKEFSNLNTVSSWVDFQTTGKKLYAGLFCGYSKNLGSDDLIDGPIYSRGTDIGSVYRIAPRVVYTENKISMSLEGEYSTASYGTVNGDMKGGVTNTTVVSNFRTLLSLKYSF